MIGVALQHGNLLMVVERNKITNSYLVSESKEVGEKKEDKL